MIKNNVLKLAFAFMVTLLAPELIFAINTGSSRTKNLIIFVHGIGGNKDSFGSMPEFLPKHLNAMQSEFEYEGHIFTYPTEDDKQSTGAFAVGLSQFITDVVLKNTNGKDYKISFVAHSQGGLVVTIWYYQILISDPRFNHDHLDKIHTVVTLGTPFWGSKIASIAAVQEWVWQVRDWYSGSDLASKLGGKKQMQDMSFSSNVMQEFRRDLYKIAPALKESNLSNIRFLNVAGNANLKALTQKKHKSMSGMFTNLLPFVFGNIEYESDGAVLIPSSTLNTYYHRNISDDYEENVAPAKADYQYYDFADRFFVRTVHAFNNTNELQDISFVSQNCSSLSTCDHPVYPYLVDYFLGKKIPLYAPDVKYHNFGGFTLDINVQLPKGYEDLRDKVKIFFNPECFHNKVENDYTVYTSIASPIEINSKMKTLSTRYKDTVSFWFTGDLYRKGDHVRTVNKVFPMPNASKEIEVIITAPQMKTRRIKMMVQPTISSYAEVNLVRK